jgi:hypothetical protein
VKSFQAQTHYEVLEISVGATVAEVKSAYERLSQLYSDDQVVLYGLIDPNRAAALRTRLKEALEILLDDDRRDAYDVKIGLPPRDRPKKASASKAPPVSSGAGASAGTGWGAFSWVTPSSAPTVAQPGSYTYTVTPAVAPVVAQPQPVISVPAPSAFLAPVQVPVSPEIVAAPPSTAPTVAKAEQQAPPTPQPAPEPVVPAREPEVAQLDLGVATGPNAWSARGAPVVAESIPVAPPGSAPVVVAAPVATAPVVVAAPPVSAPEPIAAPAASAPVPVVAPPVPSAHVLVAPPPSAPLPLPLSPPVAPAPVAVPVVAAPAPAAAEEVKPVEAPPEPELPRLSDEVEVAIVPARASPAREVRMEQRSRPYEVPPDVEFNGDLLRQVRMARGLSLVQLAERTRIGVKHLENVEGDRYDALPVGVYLRGILMSLARELGLDGVRVSKSYQTFVDAHRSKG